ncbi:ion transporter [Limibacter armeniacum]|uniref:ion transporter n=1 Tax=Limibacter armeniacum TaxID=466084 RepID=UPI002FE60876
MTIREKIYNIIDNEKNLSTRLFDAFMTTLIILNVAAIILESHQSLATAFHQEFFAFEIFSVFIFTIELMLRIIVADIHYKSENYLNSVIRYLFSFSAIVDILAIMPFYLPMFLAVDLRFIRMLRLVRLLRVLKIGRYNKALKAVAKALGQRKEELFLTSFVGLVLLLFSGTLMYYVEHETQPDAFPNITASLWWAIATLTTVGYGDVYPVTTLGKFIAGIIAFIGVGFVALPTGILSSAFMEQINRREQEEKEKEENIDEHKEVCSCPHCGKEL